MEEVQTKINEAKEDHRSGNGSYGPTEKNLIPGKYLDDSTSPSTWKFNDEIKWNYCSVKDENSTESTAYIGFKFPYTVLEITSNSVDPYYNRSTEELDFINDNLVKRIDDGTHPFFESFHISVPKGIKGDTFKNFRVVTASDVIQDYDGKADDVDNQREILVYDYYHFDKNAEGEPVSLFLGDYNMIKNITLDDEGTFTIDYTHDDQQIYNKKIKWIKSVTLNTDTGHFVVEYNQTDETGENVKYETDLDWITGLTIDNDGTVKVQHINKSEDILTTKIKWPTSIAVNTGETEGTGNQKINVTYNDNTNVDIGNPINYIMQTVVDNGHLLCLYSDPRRRQDIINKGENYTYNGRNDWHDLGVIISNSGILIGKYYDTATYPQLNSISNTIAYLTQEYPNGLIGEQLDGKIVTVGSQTGDKEFYGFDYSKTNGTYHGWYFLGKLSTEVVSSIVGKENDASLTESLNALPINGIWFIQEEN